jgi:type I restriction enzyme S subunit
MLRITDIQENAVDWPSVPGCSIDPETVEQYKLQQGDILIARTGGTIGKTFLVGDVPITAVFASYLIRVQGSSHVFDQFLKLFLESSLYWTQLRDGTRGTGQPNVNGQTLGKLVLPLAPLAEQHRIVAKVDELMALCDRLEAARAEREATRDRLAASSLARLNVPDPETFQADARFALDALPALTTRPDQIKQLRQSILNLAVRGMLVPQDPNDEPIPLLAATRPTSAILPSHGNRRTEGKQASLPSGWIVAKGELAADFIDPQPSHRTPPRYDGGIPYIGYGDITSCGKIDFEGARKVSPDVLVEHRQRYTLQKGDFVIGKIGTIGDPVFLEPPFNYTLSANLMLVQPKSLIVAPAYMFVFFESPIAIATLQLQSTDGTHAVFGIKKARELLIPLPPIAEQHRIVAKVDALMALCDRLEASLTSTAATRRRLLEALLAEALAPVEDRELEAAE